MAKSTVNRDKSGKFKKGNKSGGRKPIPPEIKEALTELVPDAIEKLKEIIRTSSNEKVLIQAINTILDRVYGKPNQAIDQNVNINKVNPLEGLTTEELKKLVDVND